MTKEVTEYRLSWEMPDRFWADGYRNVTDYTDVWDYIPWKEPTVKISTDYNQIIGQYRMLKQWASTKQQPIRNVVLERRKYTPTDWEPYEL